MQPQFHKYFGFFKIWAYFSYPFQVVIFGTFELHIVLENLAVLLLCFYRCEQEEIELKHNSALKQLLNEFNTQLAQKDQELELVIKETSSKLKKVSVYLI